MEEILYQGKLVEVIRKEVNLGKIRKVVELGRRAPGVRLVIPKGNEILLSREFRHEVNGYDYRLPGGKVYDRLTDYNAALKDAVDIQAVATQAAIKEAKEEAGIDVADLSFLHRSVCGSTIVWDLFYFVVGAFTESEQHLEEGEDITTEYIDRETVRQMCLDGSISEERSALVLLRYLNGTVHV